MPATPAPPVLPARLRALGLRWRPAAAGSAADQGFVRDLFASTRERELQALGAGTPLARQLIEMQCAARDHAYRAAHPAAVQRIVEHAATAGVAQPIGMLWVSMTSTPWDVLDIALLPPWRGRGIGGALLSALLEEAQAAHMPVALQVRVDNPARHLYARLGFVPVASTELDLAMRWAPAPASPSTTPSPAETHHEQA